MMDEDFRPIPGTADADPDSPWDCPDCGGTMAPREVTHLQMHRGRPVVVRGAPAHVCRQCGMTAYTGWVGDRILAALTRSPDATMTADVYHLDVRTS